ncbi:hypothetical protein D9M73_250740 [compost metagenome]
MKQYQCELAESAAGQFTAAVLHSLAQSCKFFLGVCQYQRRLGPQAFDQRSHQVAFTDSGVALYMQVLVQVGSKCPDQMILCTA